MCVHVDDNRISLSRVSKNIVYVKMFSCRRESLDEKMFPHSLVYLSVYR